MTAVKGPEKFCEQPWLRVSLDRLERSILACLQLKPAEAPRAFSRCLIMGCSGSKTGVAASSQKPPMPVAAAESKASTEAPTAEDRVEEAFTEARDSAVVAGAEVEKAAQEALETAVAGAKEQGLDLEIAGAEPTSGCNLFGACCGA
ncbi:unnamed protein product [Symbiodinium sp. KB8]|nr:unnamed protein product [Symbiodinium sp. KB8]